MAVAFTQRIRMTNKTCRKCLEDKGLSEFYADHTKGDGLSTHCKSCKKAASSAYRKKNHEIVKVKKRQHYWANLEKTRDARRFERYNVSKEWFEKESANGCEVCGTFENLCIDHDHSCCPGKTSCGKCVRGILCSRCNTAEGYLSSDKELVKSLLRYMEKYELKHK